MKTTSETPDVETLTVEVQVVETRAVEDPPLLLSTRWSTRTAMLFGSGLGLALAVSIVGAAAYHEHIGVAGTIVWLSVTTIVCTMMGFSALWYAGHFIRHGISQDISPRQQPYLFIGNSIVALFLFATFMGVTLFGVPLFLLLVVTLERNRRRGTEYGQTFVNFFQSILLIWTTAQEA